MCAYATNAPTARSGATPARQQVSLDPAPTSATPRWAYAIAVAVVVLAVAFVVMHLAGEGVVGH